jgi:ribosome maturation factor RimP
VTLRELREGEATRRLEGTLTAVDKSTLTIDDNDLGAVTVAFDAIERARTVFAWGATKPATSKGTKASSTSKKG